MSKIYSRWRLQIPNISNKNMGRNSKNIKKASKILIILLIAILVFKTILDAVGPVFDAICKEKAKSLATIITNEQVSNIIKEYSYEDIFTIEKDNEGNINMIKLNVVPVNQITSSIAVNIQNEINNQGRDDIGIALGTFTGVKLLASRGPNVNIKISTIGNIETELKSEFAAQGINQTLHRVYLQIKCNISILTPFNTIEEQITNQVLIAENVIVGKIPSTYYNLEGLEGSQAIEVVE